MVCMREREREGGREGEREVGRDMVAEFLFENSMSRDHVKDPAILGDFVEINCK